MSAREHLPVEQRMTALIYVKSITFNFADGIQLSTGIHGATLWVAYLYHKYVPGNAEMPCEEEDVDLLSATLLQPIWLTDSRGITVSIDGRCDVLSILTDAQYEKLEQFILDTPQMESINTRELVL